MERRSDAAGAVHQPYPSSLTVSRVCLTSDLCFECSVVAGSP